MDGNEDMNRRRRNSVSNSLDSPPRAQEKRAQNDQRQVDSSSDPDESQENNPEAIDAVLNPNAANIPAHDFSFANYVSDEESSSSESEPEVTDEEGEDDEEGNLQAGAGMPIDNGANNEEVVLAQIENQGAITQALHNLDTTCGGIGETLQQVVVLCRENSRRNIVLQETVSNLGDHLNEVILRNEEQRVQIKQLQKGLCVCKRGGIVTIVLILLYQLYLIIRKI